MQIRLLLILGGVFLLGACSKVPATNPFDEATPESQRASGSITGTLALEGPCADAQATDAGAMEPDPAGPLCPVSLEAFEVELVLSNVDTSTVIERRSPGVGGGFTFSDVPAGFRRAGWASRFTRRGFA